MLYRDEYEIYFRFRCLEPSYKCGAIIKDCIYTVFRISDRLPSYFGFDENEQNRNNKLINIRFIFSENIPSSVSKEKVIEAINDYFGCIVEEYREIVVELE